MVVTAGLSAAAGPDYSIQMIELAGSVDRVVPGHDVLQFQKFPTEGRVAKIK